MTTQSQTRVVVLSAGVSVPSTTRLLADRIGRAVRHRAQLVGVGEMTLESVELRPLARDLADHLVSGVPSTRLREALASVAAADAVVAVTPVFTASYSGLFKTFVDVLDPDALTGTPVLVAATAGTARHSLVLEHALRPLFSYLRAVVVPTGVFAATDDFGAGEGGRGLDDRIARAAGELVALLPGASDGRRPSADRVTDEAGRLDVLDADVTPFARLLAGG